MPNGGHYAVIETSDYRSQYDEYVVGNSRLERAHIGLVQWLERAPKSFPVSEQVHADYWMARLYGPPALAVFYTVDEEDRSVTLNGMAPWP